MSRTILSSDLFFKRALHPPLYESKDPENDERWWLIYFICRSMICFPPKLEIFLHSPVSDQREFYFEQ